MLRTAPPARPPIVALVIGGVVVFLFVVGLFYLGSLRWHGNSSSSSAATAATADHATVQSMQQEQATVAAVELDRIQSRINEVIRQAEQLGQARTEWTTLTQRLLTDNDGRLIAAQPDRVKAFIAMQRQEHAPSGLSEDIKRRANQLLQDIRAARANSASAWSPGRPTLALIEPDETAVSNALKTYRDAIQQVLALVQAGRDTEPAPATLQEAINDVEALYARQQAAAIAAARDEAERTAASALAKAEADKTLAVGEAQRLQVEADTQKLREQARVERLKSLAADAAIQAKYTPLLDKGYVQLGWNYNRGRVANQKTERAQPLSLSAIQYAGLLKNVEAFAQLMCGVGDTATNDRRKRSDYPKNEEDWKRWEEMRREFSELAPIWVEMGLLSK